MSTQKPSFIYKQLFPLELRQKGLSGHSEQTVWVLAVPLSEGQAQVNAPPNSTWPCVCLTRGTSWTWADKIWMGREKGPLGNWIIFLLIEV